MAINAADAEVIVSADTSRLLPKIRAAMTAIEREAGASSNRISTALTKMTDKMEKSGGDAAGGMWGPILAATPLITSGISAIGGGLTAMIGSMYKAAASGASLAGIYGALGQAAVVAKIAFSGFGAAIGGNADAMKKLAPNAQAAVKAVQSLKPAWEGLKKSVQGAVFAGMAGDIKSVGGTLLPILQKQFTATGTIMNGMFKDLAKFVQSKGFVSDFSAVLRGNNVIFANLAKAAVPLLNGLINLFRAIQPQAIGLSKWIAQIAQRFSDWAAAGQKSGSIGKFMAQSASSAKVLLDILKNLAVALNNVFLSSASAGDGLWASIDRITKKFADFTGTASGKSAIAGWAAQGATAMNALGKILATIAIGAKSLFNPALFNAFLGIIQQVLPALGQIVKIIEAALMPVIQQFGSSMKTLGPQLAQLFVALAPLLKGLGTVLADIVGEAASTLSALLPIIIPIVRIISAVLGPALQKLAPIIAFVVIGFTDFGGAIFELLGKLPLVGKMLAPMTALVKAAEMSFGLFTKGIEAGLKVIRPFAMVLGNAFTSLEGYIRPVVLAIEDLVHWILGGSPGLIPAFQELAKAIVAPLNLVKTLVVGTFNALRNAVASVIGFISAHWKTIAIILGGPLAIAVSIVVKHWTQIKNFIQSVVKAIVDVVRRYINLVRTVIVTVINAIRTIWVKVWGTIFSVIAKVLQQIGVRVRTAFLAIRNVISTVMGAVRAVLNNVWRLISTMIRNVLNSIRTMISNTFRTIQTIIRNVMNAIRSVMANIWGAIRSLVSNVVGAIKNIVSNGFGAVRNSISNAMSAARNLVSGAMSAIRSAISSTVSKIGSEMAQVPGKISAVVGKVTSAGASVGRAVMSGINSGLKTAVSFAGDLINSVRNAINSALHLPLTVSFDKGPIHIHATVIPALAEGIKNFQGGLAMVGEAGPELVRLPKGTDVFDADVTRRALNNAGNRVSSPAQVTAPPGQQPIAIAQNFYGPTTSGGRLKELDWTVRYATKARRTRFEGAASA